VCEVAFPLHTANKGTALFSTSGSHPTVRTQWGLEGEEDLGTVLRGLCLRTLPLAQSSPTALGLSSVSGGAGLQPCCHPPPLGDSKKGKRKSTGQAGSLHNFTVFFSLDPSHVAMTWFETLVQPPPSPQQAKCLLPHLPDSPLQGSMLCLPKCWLYGRGQNTKHTETLSRLQISAPLHRSILSLFCCSSASWNPSRVPPCQQIS